MKDEKKLIILLFLVGLSFVLIGTGLKLIKPIESSSIDNQIITYMSSNKDSLYLSDIDYIANQSYARWDKIRYDEVNGGGKITVRIENNIFTFEKGIWAHASSQVTYDISKYDYKYFTAFVGINTTSGSGDGVKYYIYTSVDGNDWNEATTVTKKPGENATFIKVDISNVKYLRLVANDNGSNGNDHSVYADAKLVNETEDISAFKSIEEYDEIIKTQYANQADITSDVEFNLLQRQLINNAGKFTINSFYNESNDNKEALDFLMSNPKALKYYVLGGKPLGNNYYKSLTEYSRLYRNYKNDFNNTEVTKYGTVLGDLYLRMATSLSLTHSTLVGLWMNNASTLENQSDSVRRYAIIKYMHKNNLFQAGGMDYNSWFENYTVEEMRYVMANNIDDQSMLWLNSYVRELIEKEGGARLWPHRYIAYVWPNYANPIYYAEENKDYFNELFSVRDPKNENSGERIGLWDVVYTIPGGVDEPEYNLQIPRGTSDNKIYKLWMNMRNKFGTGSVCGGISKTGANIRGVLGLPDAVVGQPGHAAHINYFQNSKGEGYWGIDNDVSGWAYTGSSILLGWASAPYASGYTGTYIPLAQEVINHEDTYEQSQGFVYLADSYTDLAKKEEFYRKALEIQPLNLNAWYGLILTYNASDNKTEEQYYELAKEIAEALKYYPLPMYQMTNQIKPKLTSIQESYKFTLLQTRILKDASVIPNNSTEVLQPSITRLMGNFLLGQMDTSIATFSFDGDDAGKIVLSSRFDGNGVRWDYSIDGKQTWKEVSFSADEEHKLQLTKEEIAALTSENDLYIHIVGVNYNEENLYKIDIQESLGLPATLFASDLENKLLGAVDTIEWKYEEKDNWTTYKNKQPDLTGDKTVILRMGATETYLASKTSTTFTFTKDVVNKKRKYIPIEHLSLHAVSTEAVNNGGSASFALDANYNTRWHSAWNGSDTERYITVKLDQPYNISAVEFVPAGGGNGKIYDGTVWGSMDGENWTILTQSKNLTYTNAANTVEEAILNIKSFDIDAPQRVQYVKIVADRTNGNWVTARAFNFYEDTTIKNVATFSFDGTNAGTISLFDDFKNKKWKYSIDGGDTWQKVTTNSYKLSASELDKINSENKIKIVLDGDDTEYTINIKKGEIPEKGYLNDLENKPIGQPEKDMLEWKISSGNRRRTSDEDRWTDYALEEPNVQGNKILLVRRKATGITTASDSIEYQFTEDNQSKTEKYISIEHLSIHDFSTQSQDSKRPHYAPNAIDGNPNTQWHTDFRTSIANTEAFLTIKVDEPKYISGLDYLHMNETAEPYGFMKTGKVYVSEDGENWNEAAIINDVAKDDTLKHISFDKAIYGQYVKLVVESHDNVFAAASMINLYEDGTKNPVVTPTAKVEYSTTRATNGDVVATFVSDDTDITITNNNGKKTYTFTKNGTFTFEFVDKAGNKGTVVATVKNIDKTAPIGTVKYSMLDITNDDVVVTLTANEDITVTNNDGKTTYTFKENGTFTFEFVDKAGNKGTATAQVTWINRNAPTASVKYSTVDSTNKSVVATLTSSTDITVTNNGGKKTYTFTDNGEFTFEFVDKAGNKGATKAKVTWIDKVAPKGVITYSITEITNKNVVASLITNEDVTVTNNGGNKNYTFKENGKFTFEFVDKAGNKGTVVATVKNIDKTAPTAKVTYSTTEPTNKDVVVTLTDASKDITITNNEGKNTYTFTKNGTFTFEFVDKAGNKGTVVATVNNIDKTAPTAKVIYSTTQPTNKDVVVTLTNASEDITITNNGGNNTYTFVDNGTFTFEFVDKVGNKGTVVATVNNIDKTAPTAKVTYSTTEPTNEDVVVTLTDASEDITITNNEGKNTYTFTKNGTFTFEFVDKVGNKGTAQAIVNNINKTVTDVTITYSLTELTNKDVVATISSDKKITITNNEGKNTYTFTKNGTFTFEYVDELGNEGAAVAIVNNIDKTAPTAKITYSTTQQTNKDVTVTLTDASEDIIITNNGGKNTYTFTKNGTFTFEFVDKAGNKGTVLATVSWIVVDTPGKPDTPENIEKPNTPGDSNNQLGNVNTDDENYEIVHVPNTGSEHNIYVTAIGMMIISSGIGIVRHSSKKNEM